jgi:predicted negative regulator of RcsB-dependent stress response
MTKEQLFEKAAGDLAAELGNMHGTLYKLIIELRTTRLTTRQRDLINEAMAELRPSQERFFAKYADGLGGVAPERN